MALLAQLLVAFGAAAGRHFGYTVEATRHHLNEFIVLVGASGKGRKGSSWDHVERILGAIDPDFAGGCVASVLGRRADLRRPRRERRRHRRRGQAAVDPRA